MIDEIANEKQEPKVYLELPEEIARTVVGMKPGTPVKILLRGEVCAITLREPYDAYGSKYVGNLDVEVSKMRIERDAENELATLFEDED